MENSNNTVPLFLLVILSRTSVHLFGCLVTKLISTFSEQKTFVYVTSFIFYYSCLIINIAHKIVSFCFPSME